MPATWDMKRSLVLFLLALGILTLPTCMALAQSNAHPARSAKPHLRAQQLVETTLAHHPELSGVELSSTLPGTNKCQTVASTDPHDIGDQCDEDELTPMRTNQPFAESEVENGKHVWDITSPLHDSTGKMVGAVGMDITPEAAQTRESVLKLTAGIMNEMERQIPSKAALFEPIR